MSDVERLQRIYRSLNHQEQQTLLYFAEFLEQNSEPVVVEKLSRVEIPRPQEEKVIHALRRLAQSYPMLKDEEILKQGADMMSLHFVSGRPAEEVIDELEEMFATHYKAYLEA